MLYDGLCKSDINKLNQEEIIMETEKLLERIDADLIDLVTEIHNMNDGPKFMKVINYDGLRETIINIRNISTISVWEAPTNIHTNEIDDDDEDPELCCHITMTNGEEMITVDTIETITACIERAFGKGVII